MAQEQSPIVNALYKLKQENKRGLSSPRLFSRGAGGAASCRGLGCHQKTPFFFCAAEGGVL